jgi:hypothetical protein
LEGDHTSWRTGFSSFISNTNQYIDTSSSTTISSSLTFVGLGIMISSWSSNGQSSISLETDTIGSEVQSVISSVSNTRPWELSESSSISTQLIFGCHNKPQFNVLVVDFLKLSVFMLGNSRLSFLSTNERTVLTEFGSLTRTIDLGSVGLRNPLNGGRRISSPGVNLQSTSQCSDGSLDRVECNVRNIDGLSSIVQRELEG